jgi:N-acetylmuramoyl-L-alanine amidase
MILLPCLLGACAAPGRIDTTYSSASQDSRVQFIVLHFTSSEFGESLETLTQGPVSSHYLIRDDPPTIYRLVGDGRRAFHAGESSWQGNTQLNAASIGIELVNLGYRETPQGPAWFDYPPRQIDAAIELMKKLVREHGIRPDRILGHSDIAPQRKVDPGPKFPWKRLADAGLIRWPDAHAIAVKRSGYEQRLPDTAWLQERLAQIGYAVPRNGTFDEETRKVLSAFQMRYRPSRFDGVLDAESAALLEVLTAAPAKP